MIPERFTLSDIQQSFRDISAKIAPLLTGNIPLNGRRVTGAGVAIDKFDYVTKYELESSVDAAVNSGLKSLTNQGTTLSPGPVYAATPIDQYHLAVGAVAKSGQQRIAEIASLGTSVTVLHGAAAGPPTFGAVVLTTDVSGVLPLANGGSDRTVVALTNQAATVGPTALASAGSQFRLSYSLLITTTDIGAATVTVSATYDDDIGTTSQSGIAVAVTAANRQTGTFIIERASGNVTYTVTVTGSIGSAKFAFYATLERLS